MRLKKSIPHHKITHMRQPAFAVHKNKAQRVLAHRLFIPLNNIDRFSSFNLVDRINPAQRIPSRRQQPDPPR
jgi:hypothetical protein